jgi:hypothetical protein
MPAFIPEKLGIIRLSTGPCEDCRRPAFTADFVIVMVDLEEQLIVAKGVSLTPITFVVCSYDENGNILVHNSGQMPELQHMFVKPPESFEGSEEG